MTENDPIDSAFKSIMEKIYWIDDLEKAENELAKWLRKMDGDLRNLLLERREKYCKNPMSIMEIIGLQNYLDSNESNKKQTEYRIAMARELIDVGLLLQCIFLWNQISHDLKAKILTPLYKASYAYELALKNGLENIDETHLNRSIQMAEEALEKADDLGLLDELRKYIENSLGKFISSTSN
ncbi:MAG: hypothetical protein C0171_01805 [Caldisphaera sp.]|nr:MAG: hypothetical protein C0201_01095 [Caldisphaera sp.]PMP92018.1 MAG: hypothetical protein C0171_01805 [Caldisphaera sp.]